MDSKFTAEQLDDWKAYEEVRSGGRYNMITDRGALLASGLTRDQYLFVIKHYEALMKAVEKEDAK